MLKSIGFGANTKPLIANDKKFMEKILNELKKSLTGVWQGEGFSKYPTMIKVNITS